MKQIAHGITLKVKNQALDTPEGRLMFAVFDAAMREIFQDKYKKSAKSYLQGYMPHLGLIGVDVEWVKTLFKKSGMDKVIADA